jgi:CelD/BcsL family acetyltransferase involved in cellulose biosynthesis
MEHNAMEPVRVSLAYRLGELTLFERVLEGLADRTHFTLQESFAGLPSVPKGGDGTQFYFFPCYPVDEPPPVLIRRYGWIYYTPYSFRNHFIDLRQFESFEQYLGKFSSKSRSTLRRKVRRLAEENGGEVRWRVMCRPEEMQDFLRLALPLSARTYQERLLGAGLPQTSEFADRLAREASAGNILGYLLFKGDSPVAYVLCFCRDGIATYDYVGFEPSAQALSPGTVLQYLMLESMFVERKVDIFDFTEGEGPQKEFFATEHRLCAKSYVLRDTLYNRMLVRAHLAMDGVSTVAGAALDKLRLKKSIKRLLRRGA